jgi:hypothetical protein
MAVVAIAVVAKAPIRARRLKLSIVSSGTFPLPDDAFSDALSGAATDGPLVRWDGRKRMPAAALTTGMVVSPSCSARADFRQTTPAAT